MVYVNDINLMILMNIRCDCDGYGIDVIACKLLLIISKCFGDTKDKKMGIYIYIYICEFNGNVEIKLDTIYYDNVVIMGCK